MALVNEAEADDGAVHRFYRFVEQRRAAGLDVDLDDVVRLLVLIIIFDAIADSIPDPG